MAKATPLIKPAENVIAQNKANSNQLDIMRFPDDLGAHAMILNFKKYEYGAGQVQNELITSSITLPIPRSIEDTLLIKVDARELDVLGAAAADVINSARSGGIDGSKLGSQTFDAISSAVQGGFTGTLTTDTLSAMRYFSRAGLSVAGLNNVGSAIDIVTGAIVNPHATVVFDGMNLKNFDFDWILAPKNEKESQTLKRIIDKIRIASLPAYTAAFGTQPNTGTSLDRGLLKYPDMVDIFFVGLDQRYFFYYKTCMISRIRVDYAPNGITLNKGVNGARPSVINLSISLTESSIHTKDDYIETMDNGNI
jgi:hypothetical protein